MRLTNALLRGSGLALIALLAACGGPAVVGTSSVATTNSASVPTGDPIAFSSAVYAAAQSAGSVTLTVNRSGGSSGAVAANYATSNGTAVAGTNYTAQSGTLSWAAGDASAKTIVVQLSSTAFSGTLTFDVTLSAPADGATLGTPATATVSISGSPTTDNETVAFSAATYAVAQSAGSVTLSVNRAGGTSGALAVNYATSNGTAVAGTNYTAKTGTLSWAAGDATAKTIVVPVSSTAFSGTLTFDAALSAPAGGAALGSPATATVSISGSSTASSESVALSASTYSVAQSAGSVTIPVNRGGGTTGALAVNYATSNGTAVAGTNYTTQSGTLSWAAGDASAKNIVVPVSATAFSGTLTFKVALSAPADGATLGTPATATVSISGSSTTSSESVALSAASYSVAQGAGSVTMPVNRSGGTTGAVTVAYATSNGTAVAGQNYTAQSGTLSWAAGDASAKSITVPISSTVISGTLTFGVALSKPSGATVGTPATTTVSINKNSNISIAISGSNLVDGTGKTVQLRGVNVAGLETVAVEGWDPSNPWGASTGTTTPNWSLMQTWGVNAVRLPLNEASWLGASCVDMGGVGYHFVNGVRTANTPGELVSADPGSNYQATVATAVSQATAAGLYVILDLHLTAPSNVCPSVQSPMADADNSVKFWSSLAAAFKGNPAVIFELFNEPFLDGAPLTGTTPWTALINGGTLTSYTTQTNSSPYYETVQYTWQTAGMQAMLNAVRATGATNVVLTSTLGYAGDLGGWLQYHPTDTLNPSQVGAVWHTYPGPSAANEANCSGLPACSTQLLADTVAIRAAGYPVVITEFGDPSGGTTAPWSAVLLPFADLNGVSYMAWTWNPWVGTTYYLITDAAGDPTVGYGQYIKAHYQCRAAGNLVCL